MPIHSHTVSVPIERKLRALGQAFEISGANAFDFAGGASLQSVRRAGLDAAARGRFAKRAYQTTNEPSAEASGLRICVRKPAEHFLNRVRLANHLCHKQRGEA